MICCKIITLQVVALSQSMPHAVAALKLLQVTLDGCMLSTSPLSCHCRFFCPGAAASRSAVVHHLTTLGRSAGAQICHCGASPVLHFRLFTVGIDSEIVARNI